MYGLVNNLLSGTLRTHYGEAVWQIIRTRLPFDAGYFVNMKPYPDAWSYALIDVACELTGDSPDTVLRVVGHRWISDNAAGEYKALFDLNGPDVFTFLSNLNNMHAALGNQMPGLRPPSFLIHREDSRVIRVRYFSSRSGLAPLVTGLLEGLCDYYGEPFTICQSRCRIDEQDYDEFRLERG